MVAFCILAIVVSAFPMAKARIAPVYLQHKGIAMALVNMKDLLNHAYANHYAVGAFEIVNLDFLRAVIAAAEQARSPVILNIVEPHFDLFDVELLMPAVVQAAKRASVPVAINMDHCANLASVQSAIRLGCNGLMYDGAHAELPVNIEQTRKAVELAHSCGVPVEGELGYVPGIKTDNGDEDQSVQTSANEAVVFAERSGVDFLAISIGTVHGQGNGKTRLDYNRLARINESVGIPLVIHGGTGLSDQQYLKLIDQGVAKINYFTALSEIVVNQVRNNIAGKNAGYRNMIANLHEEMTAAIQRMMQMWRSAGRAAEVMIQCGTWNNVEHVIVYNSSESDPTVIQIMLRKGKQELGNIPGVLDVRIGRAKDDKSKYRYCWLIRFTHERVIESYKNHPAHVAYADNYFRPIAADRVSNDFVIIDDLELGRQFHT
jgi:fructose-bisphosphate aldolase class II